MSLFNKKQLFNPDGDDSVAIRQMIKGNITNILNLNDVKYAKISKLYKIMRENFWIPEKFPLSQDVVDIKNLSEDELTAYKGILGFLTFLDSIQTNNVPNIAQYITSAEVVLALTEQASQEALHSNSYAYIFESVLAKDEIRDVYEYWRDDEVLLERVSYIAKGFQDFLDNDSEENFKRVIILNYLLEGLYFYNGFQFFYLLSSKGMMGGTSDIIKVIQKDETTHLVLFEEIINDVIDLNTDRDMIIDLFNVAVEQEITWSNHIIGDKILGMTKISIEEYTKYLANERLGKIGIEPQYYIDGILPSNQFTHLEIIADAEGEGTTKTNFFESSVTSYNQSSAVSGWDDIKNVK